MSEIENLLNELRNMKSTGSSINNSKEVWARIGSGESFSDIGFESIEEFEKFIIDNPYANL